MTGAEVWGRPVRIGVLGCADIAWRRTLPAMLGEKGVDLVAVASRQAAKAERFAERFGCAAVEGYEALLKRDDIDAVYVPLPARMHAEWVGRALEAGKHVFAEKPLTTEVRATRELVALARASDLVLLENFMFLYHAQHRAVDELVADGAIGDLRGFSSAFTIPPRPADAVRDSPDSGDALFEVGVYPIRAAVRFLGPRLELVGAALRLDRRTGAVLSGAAQLVRPDDGGTAQLTFGMEHCYRTSYELTGSCGRLSLDRVFTPPDAYQPVLRLERQAHREERTLAADAQFPNVVRAFAHAVRTGDRLEELATSSVHNAALVEQIRDRAHRVHVEAL
ncbi:Gfo/Idh/MocA family protein [Streptomyces sp. NPDC087844]|uniref:Gfo/Idh/MocA family protein n=1 Tax=Streptomyces sp. NPDC087844 TaxID=3365805 RepID=UPI003826478D